MPIIISIGGSIIVPDEIDVPFLKKLKTFFQKQKNNFILIIGGGKTARKYQHAAQKLNLDKTAQDWIGIASTTLNAELLHYLFPNSKILENPFQKTKAKILIAHGWKPGRSTDYVAVALAKTYNAKLVINLTNQDYVFDKDPRKFKDAKILKQISWKQMKKIVGNKWRPGLNMPFDPIASKLASKLKIRVAIANGRNLKNLKKIIDNKPFKGTLIS